jgi:hypothetical protein
MTIRFRSGVSCEKDTIIYEWGCDLDVAHFSFQSIRLGPLMNHDDVTSSAPLNGYEVRSGVGIVV